MLCSRPPQAGHLKPSGHRDATITARHCSSLPYCRSNAGSLSPFWNCTALRAISIPPPKALVCSWFVPYPGRLSKVRNQVGICANPFEAPPVRAQVHLDKFEILEVHGPNRIALAYGAGAELFEEGIKAVNVALGDQLAR